MRGVELLNAFDLMMARDDQQMGLGSGRSVGKDHDVIVLVNDFVRCDDKILLPFFQLGGVW